MQGSSGSNRHHPALLQCPFVLRIQGQGIDRCFVTFNMMGRFEVLIQVFDARVQDMRVAQIENPFGLSQQLLLHALLDTLPGIVGDAVAIQEVVGHLLQLIVIEITISVVGEIGSQVVSSL